MKNIWILALLILMPISWAYVDNQHFIDVKTYYNRFITCPTLSGSQDNVSIEGLLQYSIGGKKDYPDNSRSCGADDVFDQIAYGYGMNGDTCDNYIDNSYSISSPLGSCDASRSILPYAVYSCSVICDTSKFTTNYREYPVFSEKWSGYYDGVYSSLVTDTTRADYSSKSTYNVNFKYRCTYPSSMINKNITMRVGCVLKLKDYYTHPSYTESNFIGYLQMDLYQLSTQNDILNKISNDLGLYYENIHDYGQTNQVYVDVVQGAYNFYGKDYKDITFMLTQDSEGIKLNETWVNDTINDTSSYGGESGGLPSNPDSLGIQKQIEFGNQMEEIINQQSFILSMLEIAQTIFAIMLLVFYLLEIFIVAFVFTKWLPDMMLGLTEIVKRFIKRR